MLKFNRTAQITIEYAVLIAFVAAACVAMLEYGKRAVNENLRVIESQN